MMRVLIVEDERVLAERLERLLREAAEDEPMQIERCATLEAASSRLESGGVDVLFLDLNLNGQDGFDLLTDAAASPFHTVVVSAHTDRALEAFEVGVLDFVGKPFNVARIRKTMDRLRGVRADHPAAALAVRSAGRIELVPVADVAYVQAAGSYSELVLRDGTARPLSKTLDQLLSVLPATFERVHRSYLIRLDEVVQIKVRKGSRYAAVLASGEEISIGRTRVDAIRARLVLL